MFLSLFSRLPVFIKRILCPIVFRAKKNEVLLKDKRFYIDREFFDIVLKNEHFYYFELIKIPLKELRLPQPFDSKKVTASPVYQYLCFSKEERKRTDSLKNNIEKNGYTPNSVVIITERGRILDGQHRSCVLMSVFGENHVVTALRLYRKKHKRPFFFRKKEGSRTFYFFGITLFKVKTK